MSDAWTNSTPLSNSDFRALLSTPRPHGGGGQQPRERQQKPHGEKKEHKFKKPAPRPKPHKPGQDEPKEDGQPGYRDRAKERREGRLDKEYMQKLEEAGLNPEALVTLNEEQSKFFGGDENFSHLVKGLDYALLEREREKEKQEQEKQQAAKADGPMATPRSIFKAPVAFETPLGRAVYEAACKPPPNRKALIREMFLPRRTAFVYDFDPETGGGDVPTTLRRSKADCPPVQERIFAGADKAVLEAIAKIMTYLSSNMGTKGGKKPKRKDHSDFIRSILMGTTAGHGDTQVHGQLVVKNQSAITAAKAAAAAAAAGVGRQGGAAAAAGSPAAAADDDDDDIFGDAGTDYVPEIPKKDKDVEAGRRGEGGSYFDSREKLDVLPASAPAVTGEEDMDIEEGEVGLPPPPPPGGAAAAGGTSGWQQYGNGQQQQGYVQYGGQDYDAYYGQQQQQQQEQGYGGQYGAYHQGYQPAAAKPPEELPKWRAPAKVIKGFKPEAYDECFPEMGGFGDPLADSDEEVDKKGAKGAKGPEEEGEGAAAGKGGGGKRGGAMNDEQRRNQKLDGQLQQIKRVFNEKGYGNEGAFKKERHLEVGATPMRSKRLKL